MTNLATQSTTQLETISNGVSIRSIDDVSRMAKMFAASGFFSDCREAAQVGVKILAGQELGIPPFASVTGIHLIKGKATLGAGLMAGKLKSSHKYTYRVLEHSPVVCSIEVLERIDGKMQVAGISTFTIDDAKKAGCQNLDKYARNMLFARAISNAVKFYAPDLFLGGNSVYVPEELGAVVNDDGEILGEVVEPRALTPLKKEPTKHHLTVAQVQINFFKLKTEYTTEDIRSICEKLDYPKTSSEITEDQAIVIVSEMLTEWAVSKWIDRSIASSMVSKSIERTKTDQELWEDFSLSIESYQVENRND